VGIVDDTSTNGTRYVTFLNTTSGNLVSAGNIFVSSTKLYFNPSTGDFTAGGAITAYSDRNIKTDIVPVENALARILQLQPVTYMRTDTGVFGRGLIAQDVQKIYPELVVENTEDGMLSVAYGNLVAEAIAAIQDLYNMIKDR
jgi:hypothetical protein